MNPATMRALCKYIEGRTLDAKERRLIDAFYLSAKLALSLSETSPSVSESGGRVLRLADRRLRHAHPTASSGDIA